VFTGTVEEIGVVRHVAAGAPARIEVACERVLERLETGGPICVSGVRLSVGARDDHGFAAALDAAAARTTLGALIRGSRVNLERAATPDTVLGGHVLRGEVEATVPVRACDAVSGETRLRLGLAPAIARYVVRGGWIALDGASLTVARVGKTFFEVVPGAEAARRTTLGALRPGDAVNVETDLIARYVERLLRR